MSRRHSGRLRVPDYNCAASPDFSYWDGDEVMFDEPENWVLVGDVHIGEPLRFSEHHVASLCPDFPQTRVPWTKMYRDKTAEEKKDDENSGKVNEKPNDDTSREADDHCTFYMGRGTGQYNGSYRRHVVAMPVTRDSAVVLEESRGVERGAEDENYGARSISNIRLPSEFDGKAEFVRVGLLDFNFVESIDWARHMTEFFGGCEIRTLWIV